MKDKHINWPILCAIIAVVLVLAVLGGLIGKEIYTIHEEKRLSEYAEFSKEYSVYALTGTQDEPGEQMTLTFEGEKNPRGEFRGDITITNGDEVLLHYHDCGIVYSADGRYVVSVYDGWTQDMDYPKPNNMDGFLNADADWSRLSFQPMREEGMAATEYKYFVSPSADHEEAYDLLMELN